jgi:hypothetical protein
MAACKTHFVRKELPFSRCDLNRRYLVVPTAMQIWLIVTTELGQARVRRQSIQQACLAHALGDPFGIGGILEWQPINMISQ